MMIDSGPSPPPEEVRVSEVARVSEVPRVPGG